MMPNITPQQAVPRPKAQELVSLAYIRALCAQAGLNIIGNWEWDDGLDLTIGASKSGVAGSRIRNIKFHLQVKSTWDWKIRNHHIAYNLEREKFNALVAESVDPQYLVLYTMCKFRGHWIKAVGQDSTWKHAAYYFECDRVRPVGGEAQTCTVKIPVANRLTAGELLWMYRRAHERWESDVLRRR